MYLAYFNEVKIGASKEMLECPASKIQEVFHYLLWFAISRAQFEIIWASSNQKQNKTKLLAVFRTPILSQYCRDTWGVDMEHLKCG